MTGRVLNILTLTVLIALSSFIFTISAKGSLADIEHVIIFMQENRAFDHYFGTLKGVRGFNDRITIPMASGFNSFHQPVDQNDLSLYMLPFQLDMNTTSAMCMDAPQMGYEVDIAMWNNGLFDSWNTARNPGTGMSYWTRHDLPYYYELYDNFAVGDQYFQSTFTETNPNRLFLFSGSNGLSADIPSDTLNEDMMPVKGGDDHGDRDDDVVHHDQCVLDNTEPRPGFNWTTVAELLEEKQISWKVYQMIDNFDDNGNAWFWNFQKSRPGDALFEKGMMRSASLVTELEKDIKAGKLPQVSWIIAPTDQSEHASHHPAAGEALTSRLLNVLKAHPKVYAKTVFILNYDEGGQFYDHHWSPTPPLPADESNDNYGTATMPVADEINTIVKTKKPAPIGLGFRVPLLLVSPWTRGNIVNSEVFDHTSVIQFLEKRFEIRCPNISPWRRAITGDLTSFFNFDSEPDYSWPDLPDTKGYRKDAQENCKLPSPVVPSEQSMPSQEPGTRISRSLPYEFVIADSYIAPDSVAGTPGSLSLNIVNTGLEGAAFTIVDQLNLKSGKAVRQYAVDAGSAIDDSFVISNTASFKYLLLGPNGFARSFESTDTKSTECGNGSNQIQSSLSYDVQSSSLTLSLSNMDASEGKVAQDLKVTVGNSAYSSYYSLTGDEALTKEFVVSRGSNVVHRFNASNAGNWYDFEVFTSDRCHVRRFAGRMETGSDSISDPVMGFALHPNTHNIHFNELIGYSQGSHPALPMKYRVLPKRDGADIKTAGHKDALWEYHVSGSDDKTVKVWDIASERCVGSWEGHSDNVSAVVVLGHGAGLLASASFDKTIRIWNVEAGTCVRTLEGHTSWVRALAVLRNGLLASASWDKTVRLWNVETGACVQILEGHSKYVYALAVLGDSLLASGSDDKTVRVWNVEAGSCVKILEGHGDKLRALAALGNGLLASASFDKTVKIWNVEAGTCVHTLEGHSGHVRVLAVLGNGLLASGSIDKTVRVWDVETGECIETLGGHRGVVFALAVLRNGLLASGSDDKTVRIWDVIPSAEGGSQNSSAAIGDDNDSRIRILRVELDEVTNRLQAMTSERDEVTIRLQAMTTERDDVVRRLQTTTAERDELSSRLHEASRQLAQALNHPFGNDKPYLLRYPYRGGPGTLHRCGEGTPLFDYARRLCLTGGSMYPRQQEVQGFRLAAVDAIVPNPHKVAAFEAQLDTIDNLRGEGDPRFNFDSNLFSRDQLAVLDTLRGYFHERPAGYPPRRINTLYCFHGPSPGDEMSICRYGLVPVQGRDAGYFGSGCYTTLNIEYAARYAAGDFDMHHRPPPADGRYPVVMFAASVGMAYPVTPAVDYASEYGFPLGHSNYFGRPLRPGFDLHCVCVSQHAHVSWEAVTRDRCEYMELVMSQKIDLLPIAVLWFERS